MVYSARRFVVCLTECHFVFVFFSPFSIAITSLGEERANLSAFRMFDRFVLVWICRFPLPLDVWEGLRFVIVALPGLFSYLFALTLCSFVVYSKRRFILSLALRLVLVFFSSFSVAITSPCLGKREVDCVFHAFVCFALLICVSFLFLFVSGFSCDLGLWHSLDFSVNLFDHAKPTSG